MPISTLKQTHKNTGDSYQINLYRIEVCGVGSDDFDIFILGTEAAYDAWRITCEFLRIAEGWGYLFDDVTNELIERSEDVI